MVTTSLQSPKYGYHVVKSHLLRHPQFFPSQNWSLLVFNRSAARFNIDLYHPLYARAMKYQSISAWFVQIDRCGKVPVAANHHFGRSIRWCSRWVSPQWSCNVYINIMPVAVLATVEPRHQQAWNQPIASDRSCTLLCLQVLIWWSED